MNIIMSAIGLIFFILLWIVLDLKVGRKIYLRHQKNKQAVLCHSNLTLYTDGTDFYTALYQTLTEAQAHIYMMFFIWRADEVGRQFIDLLCAKSQAGVSVYLLLDHMGSHHILEQFSTQLTESGVHFAYSHIGKFPFFFFTLNQRNHRKLVAVDGQTAYLGGFNIGKEYMGLGHLGFWRDYHLKIQGTGALEVEKQFLRDWQGNVRPIQQLLQEQAQMGSIPHELICTDAAYLSHAFSKLIHEAEKEINIGTPYFIPGLKIFHALRSAQKRGVKITILIPTREDHALVKDAAMPYLRRLALNGAKIYFYQGGFFHGKLLITDQKHCLIGTANFDLRSMYANHEMSCLIHDADFTKLILASFHCDLASSRLVTYTDIARKGWLGRCKEWLAVVISPFL